MEKVRYTAIPLITVDPFFSIWSFADKLYEDSTRHWSNKRASMLGMVKIDEKYYRFMGKVQDNNEYYFYEPDVIEQTDVEVYPTKSVYAFENDILKMKLTFRTPLLVEDPELMSRPVSYISYEIEYKDNKEHNTEIYFDVCSEICVDNTSQTVSFGVTGYSMFIGKGEKDILSKCGDENRIDWGNVHIIAPGAEYKTISGFDKRDLLKYKHDMIGITEPRRVCEDFPSIAIKRKYSGKDKISGFFCVAYEDFYSIEYFGEKLKGYWTKNGDTFEDVVKKAISEYDVINKKCDEFDEKLRKEAKKISEKYADIVCLVYRQVVGAHKLVYKDGKLLFFSKECCSNGDTATVDVTYPSIPLFLLYNPDLVEGMLNPVFEFAENGHGWDFEFAPHDVGFYPKANGQVYGYEKDDPEWIRSRQMPVEECGNMLLCTASLCKTRNDYSYAEEHIKTLKQWADYLIKIGYDPECQLCTDDFAGHLAHNCNLSIKGILGIAAFGTIYGKCGGNGNEYNKIAKDFSKKWKEEAFADDHYSLTFTDKNTWSLKYNLVMDKLLDLNIFDRDIFETEVKYYKTKINKYGIPLDCREDYTKSDWQMWSVCLTVDKEYRNMIIDKMWDMICDMKERVPFSDWYYTSKPNMERFQNRTVQGGLFIPLLF